VFISGDGFGDETGKKEHGNRMITWNVGINRKFSAVTLVDTENKFRKEKMMSKKKNRNKRKKRSSQITLQRNERTINESRDELLRNLLFNESHANKQDSITNKVGGFSEKQSAVLFQFMNDLHRLMVKDKPHIKEYQKIRKLHQEVVDSMVATYEKGDFIAGIDENYQPTKAEIQAQKKSRTLEIIDVDFDLNSDEGEHVFYDLQIYKSAPNMTCITEYYINKNRFRKPEKIDLLHSMMNSVASLFEIVRVEMHEGFVYLRDVFTDQEFKITDISMSGTLDVPDIYLFMRIITHNEVSFGTGLALSFRKNDKFIKEFILKHKKPENLRTSFEMLLTLYKHHSQNPGDIMIQVNPLK